jgi:hypothetical protein
MKVELRGSLGKTLLKECLWIGKSESSAKEGEQDETSKQTNLSYQRCSSGKTCDEWFSKSYYF